MDWTKEIKQSELFIKLHRVDILKYRCWTKEHEYFENHQTFPKWGMSQVSKLDKIRDLIMNEIKTLNKN
jgi:hypothetical protein